MIWDIVKAFSVSLIVSPFLDFMRKEQCNVNCRLNDFFVCSNINVWNRLPAHVMNSDSVAVFKHRLACVNL